MAWIAVVGAAVSAAPAIYKGIKGISQTNKANGMNPVNPGYQVNQGVINNAKTLSDEYGNYSLPGYSQDVNNINKTFQGAFDQGKQGATSGADVLDLATRMAYGKNEAFNQLGQENAQGKQSMLGAYLSANAAAGQEYTNKNAYDRDQYNAQLKQKAALTQAGAENTYGAIDQLAGAAGKYAFSQAGDGSDTSDGTKTGIGNAATRAAYNKYYYPNGTPKFDANGNPIGPVMSQVTPGSNINGAG